MKANLKYIGECIKEAITVKWEKLFYRYKMISHSIF